MRIEKQVRLLSCVLLFVLVASDGAVAQGQRRIRVYISSDYFSYRLVSTCHVDPDATDLEIWKCLGDSPISTRNYSVKADLKNPLMAHLDGDIRILITESKPARTIIFWKTEGLKLVRDHPANDRWYLPKSEVARIAAEYEMPIETEETMRSSSIWIIGMWCILIVGLALMSADLFLRIKCKQRTSSGESKPNQHASPDRHRFVPQFGVRTAMLTITIVAATCALVVHFLSDDAFEPVRSSRPTPQVVRELRGLGNQVEYQDEYAQSHFTNESEILTLTFSSSINLEPVARRAGQLPRLERVSLSYCSDYDLAYVAQVRNLRQLELRTDGDLDLSPLSKTSTLRKLKIEFYELPDDIAHQQQQDLSPLQHADSITYLELDFQLDPFPSERVLLPDLSPVAKMQNLEVLILARMEIHDIAWLKGSTTLTSVDLSDTFVSDISPLESMTNLASLNLRSTPVDDVSPLAGLTGLKSLDLSSTNVSDLSPLLSCTNLEQLHARATPITAEQIISLRQSLPNCEIVW